MVDRMTRLGFFTPKAQPSIPKTPTTASIAFATENQKNQLQTVEL